MTSGAHHRTFPEFRVTANAVLMCPLLAKTGNFAGRTFVAVRTHAHFAFVALVIEYHAVRERDDIGGKNTRGQKKYCQGNNDSQGHLLRLFVMALSERPKHVSMLTL